MRKQTFRVKVFSFRNIETPFHKKGYKNFYCIVDVKNLPDLKNWREINVRDPKLTGSVPRKISESFHENPEMFLFMNRGITLSVESAVFNNQTSEVLLTMSNKDNHGLLDGGHSYTIIEREAKNLPEDETQYVKVEILEGFVLEDITNVVGARNTSNQVKDQSLMELSKKFEKLKTFLPKKLHEELISFSEYEVDKEGYPKPIDIREIIAILTCFNKDHFTDSSQPVIAYSSKKACLERFKQNPESYEKLYPIATEILQLHDHIYSSFESLYNAAAKQIRGKTQGSFGNLTGVTSHRESNDGPELFFINKLSNYTIPTPFIYPMLAAFRAFLEEKDGVYVWGKGVNPKELLNTDLAVRLVGIITEEALKNQNPNKTGKSALLWQSCYQNAELYYLKMK
jgi:hypothetical protein